jgi:hypothetical protein
MRIDTVGYGGKYEVVRRHVTDIQIRDIVTKISTSDRFEFGELSHVVLRGTDTIVGYVGNDSAELCCPNGKNPEEYRIPHSHLRRIFRASVHSVCE